MSEDPRPFRYGPRRLLLALLACMAVYTPTTSNGFVMDDEYLVQVETPGGKINKMVESWHGIGSYFTAPYWSVDAKPDRLYRPVTILSFAVVSQQLRGFFSSETIPQHWVNILLNVWAVFLSFLLLRTVRVPPGTALIGALLFGMHAIHSEAVANVVGRAEILAFCLGAAGSLTYLRSGQGTLVRRASTLILAASLLFLSFGSKESALAWVGFLPVLILVRAWREDSTHHLIEIAKRHALPLTSVLLISCGVFFWLRGVALGSVESAHSVEYVANPLFYARLDQRLLTAVMLWGYGLWASLLPMHLSSDYGAEVFQIVNSPTQGGFMFAAFALVAALMVGLRYPRRQPLLFAATACFFGFSFITSNILFATGVSFAERLYYTPSFALCLAFAWGWEVVVPKWRRVLFWGVLGWIALGALRILRRNADWKDTVTLARHDIQEQENSIRLALIVAQSLGQGVAPDPAKLDRAREMLEKIDDIQPDVPRLSSALGAIDLRLAKIAGSAQLEQRFFREAEKYFMQGIDAKHFDSSIHGADLRADLSVALKGQGRVEEALAQLDRSLDLKKGDLQRLGAMFDFDLPAAVLRKYVAQAMHYHPEKPWNRAKGLLAKAEKRYPEAVRFLSAYLQKHAGDWETHFDRAECLVAMGRKGDAMIELNGIAEDTRNPAQVRTRARGLIEAIRLQ